MPIEPEDIGVPGALDLTDEERDKFAQKVAAIANDLAEFLIEVTPGPGLAAGIAILVVEWIVATHARDAAHAEGWVESLVTALRAGTASQYEKVERGRTH